MNKFLSMKLFKVLVLFYLSCNLFSCASSVDFSAIDSFASEGNFEEALNQLEVDKNSLYSEKDAAVYYLDKGMLAHYSKDFKTSNQSLSNAELVIDNNFTKSISQSIEAFIVNDYVMDYTGEEYEDIYTNIFMALNYLLQGEVDDAFVEIKRFDLKQKNLENKYIEAIIEARSKVIDKYKEKNDSSYESSVENKVASEITFHNSALARYLSMIMYRSIGEFDSAMVDYNLINNAFAEQRQLYPFDVPTNLIDEVEVPNDMARVNLICFTGFAPRKFENVITVPSADSYFKLALPEMKKTYSFVDSIEIEAKNLETDEKYFFNLDKLESIENIAVDTFNQKKALIYFRGIARALIKSTTTATLNNASRQAEKQKDGSGGLLNLLSVSSSIYTDLSEKADIRASHYFPSTAYVGGITLEAGKYSFLVKYKDSYGNVVESAFFETVPARCCALNLLESICLK